MNVNTDVIFKAMSVGLLPAMLWVNSQSVDIALLKSELNSSNNRIEKVEAQQEKILEGVKENQIALKSMVVTMNFMKDLLTDIKNAR
jgi:NifU-like protein involved in Fe-S cluster formation